MGEVSGDGGGRCTETVHAFFTFPCRLVRCNLKYYSRNLCFLLRSLPLLSSRIILLAIIHRRNSLADRQREEAGKKRGELDCFCQLLPSQLCGKGSVIVSLLF